MGWENVFHCDNDKFCQKVLQHHFPYAQLYEDIREINGAEWKGKIDIVTGGFPCQPFSIAGQRRGTADNRFLWPEMLRIIREIQPTWIVAENVRGITNQKEGMVFERVCAEMEENGFEVQPFCIPACAVGAPHKRERMWFIATNPNSERLSGSFKNEGFSISNKKRQPQPFDGMFGTWDTVARSVRGLRSLDGISSAMVRREMKAYGNAIVPQVAYQIFQAINKSTLSE